MDFTNFSTFNNRIKKYEMTSKIEILLFLILYVGLNSLCAKLQVNLKECIFKPEDQRIAKEKLLAFSSDANLPIADLVVKIGLSFLNTPYVAATLENGLEEKLVINLRELDCTTFAESTLALARTVKLKKMDFESFAEELQKLRYRDGIRNQYPSRLHYFCEWIENNDKKGIISDKANQNGLKLDKEINYMSTHPSDYPVLKNHPELIPSIAQQEKEISAKGFMYFPKSNIANLYSNLQHGDIIALTSSIDGVDVNHVGIIIKKGNEFHLLHAPLSGKKVMVSESPITDFLKPQSKNSGIMIARPIF
jgi:hypothetical protein